ncbi:hypothetical protein ACFWUP_22035 [Nocardia sp. NPDC058658]|uniref:hypothetical protein n=1 Tax=Nocardia sp. NPDC058658 TaxID=3346580 RepID=UPI00365B3D03
MTSSAPCTINNLGYCVFRETFARDLGIDAELLDARATAVFDRITRGLASDDG